MIEFINEDNRILAEALIDVGINVKKGDNVILRRINNQFYHPNSCYVDRINTGKWLGRYSLQHFKEIRHLAAHEEISDLIIEKPVIQEYEHEQMSLF